MMLLILTKQNLKVLRRAMGPRFPGVTHCRLVEAIARALGFRTHLSALTHIASLDGRAEVRGIDFVALIGRLGELGHSVDTREGTIMLASLNVPQSSARLDETGRVLWSDQQAILLRLD